MKRLDEIFTVTYGVNLELCYLTIDDSEDAINYVSRTKSKNGVSARVSRMENVKPNPGKTISVALTGSVLEAFYQEEEYYSGRDIAYLTPIKDMDMWTMIQYCTNLFDIINISIHMDVVQTEQLENYLFQILMK